MARRTYRRPAWAPHWNSLRETIYERDKGICWACNRKVSWSGYQLGHLVEHMVGGIDVHWNLAVMCDQCNQIKPVHTTLEDAEEWRKSTNGYMGEVAEPAAVRLLDWCVEEGYTDAELIRAAEMLDALTNQMKDRRAA